MKKMTWKEMARKIRAFRRRHGLLTPAEKLEKRYDKVLSCLIGKEAYYSLYKLSPKQARAKGLI